ncbi:hypothetical protein GJ496_007770 [Pomphorhynchus laevis]|nr:hypothetical protein GJ496_007770 [Pomphorhynchus laevis]
MNSEFKMDFRLSGDRIDRPSSQCKKRKDEDEDFLIFGYTCKLFRNGSIDDDSCIVDENDLIVCPEDDSLIIDRYDCRAYMVNITSWSAANFDKSKYSMSLEESSIERQCDLERYASLNSDDTTENDEQSSAVQGARACIPFTYEDNKLTTAESSEIKEDSDEDIAFEPSDKLQLPYGMEIPKTVRQNKIIEKTAVFIAEQGLQMEILMKTKQGGNTQFSFLKYDDVLNPYYKHLLNMICNHGYDPEYEEQMRKCNQESDNDDEDSHYLHPLLFKKNEAVPEPIEKSKINLDNTPYGKLIQSLGSIQQKEEEKRRVMLQKLGIISDDKANQVDDQKHQSDVVPPPPDVLPIVDKLADYVARNGQVFEESVRQKQDPRFAFIEAGHIHHKYYLLKREYYEELTRKREEEKRKRDAYERDQIQNSHIKFLIRSKQSSDTQNSQAPVSLYVKSSDEDGGSNLSCENDQLDALLTASKEKYYDPLAEEVKKELFEDERRKDRLVSATRLKLAVESREKQDERKKRAERFLQNLKKDEIIKQSQAKVLLPTSVQPADEKSQKNMMNRLLLVDRSIKERRRFDDSKRSEKQYSDDREVRSNCKLNRDRKRTERHRSISEDKRLNIRNLSLAAIETVKPAEDGESKRSSSKKQKRHDLMERKKHKVDESDKSLKGQNPKSDKSHCKSERLTSDENCIIARYRIDDKRSSDSQHKPHHRSSIHKHGGRKRLSSTHNSRKKSKDNKISKRRSRTRSRHRHRL